MPKMRIYYRGDQIIGGIGGEAIEAAIIADAEGYVEVDLPEDVDLGLYTIKDGQLVKKEHLIISVPETLKAGEKCSIQISLLDGEDALIEEDERQVDIKIAADRGKLSALEVRTDSGEVSVNYTAPDETIVVTFKATVEGLSEAQCKVQLLP